MADQAPESDDRGIAPDWTVPEHVDPFVRQPLLYHCHDCCRPLWAIELHSVVGGGEVHHGLCATCAEQHTSPGEEPDR